MSKRGERAEFLLTESQKKTAARLYQQGYELVHICERYNVSRSNLLIMIRPYIKAPRKPRRDSNARDSDISLT